MSIPKVMSFITDLAVIRPKRKAAQNNPFISSPMNTANEQGAANSIASFAPSTESSIGNTSPSISQATSVGPNQVDTSLNDDSSPPGPPLKRRKAAAIVIHDSDSETSKSQVPENGTKDANDNLTEIGANIINKSFNCLLKCGLAQLSKDWVSPIYSFFKSEPVFEYVNGRKAHAFVCLGKSCRQQVRRYLDTGDKNSTGNLIKHTKKCWGNEVVTRVIENAKNANEAREFVKKLLETGNITTIFQRTQSSKTTYSNREMNQSETK